MLRLDHIVFAALAICAMYKHCIVIATLIGIGSLIWECLTTSTPATIATKSWTVLLKRKSRADAAHIKLIVIVLVLMVIIAFIPIIDIVWRSRGSKFSLQDLEVLFFAGLVVELAGAIFLLGLETMRFPEKPWWQVLSDLRSAILILGVVHVAVLVIAAEVMVRESFFAASTGDVVLVEASVSRTWGSWFTWSA